MERRKKIEGKKIEMDRKKTNKRRKKNEDGKKKEERFDMYILRNT